MEVLHQHLYLAKIDPLIFFSEEQFRARYRLSKTTVHNVLLPLIEADIVAEREYGLDPTLRLLGTLRYLSTGSFQIIAGDLQASSIVWCFACSLLAWN